MCPLVFCEISTKKVQISKYFQFFFYHIYIFFKRQHVTNEQNPANSFNRSKVLIFEGQKQALPLGWQHRTCSVKLSVEPGVWEAEVHRFFEACPAILSLCKHLAEDTT